MRMRTLTIAGAMLLFAGIAISGCSHSVTTSDGSKVTFEPGGKIETTDAKGNKATVSGNGDKMTIESENGKTQYEATNGTVKAHDDKGNSMEMGTGVSEADLGVPFYPGSVETKDSIKSTTDKGTTVMSNRTTTDDPAKVLEFYTGKLGKPETSVNAKDMTMASWKAGKKSETLMVSKDGTSNKISLTVVNEK